MQALSLITFAVPSFVSVLNPNLLSCATGAGAHGGVLGRDNYPEACVDAPGVDRVKLHEYIGNTALKFFDTNLNVRRQGLN
jgi:hypothetical protein